VTAAEATPSARRAELLEAAYRYALLHGLGDLSLRPLAAAIGSSPRVLLYLFGSKDGLVRALLERARAEELRLLAGVEGPDLAETAVRLWSWLVAPDHRGLLTLWAECYARSLVDADGPWAGFARATVEDWLALLASAQPRPDAPAAITQRTAVLAALRGGMLDVLATGDTERTTSAVQALVRAVS
jgi:AcrR family transcriptional regulator